MPRRQRDLDPDGGPTTELARELRDLRARAESDLWYRASFPDGRSGYVSEVYLSGASRGGLGLPDCGPGGAG